MLGLKRKDRTFELSMSRDYVNHWGVTEAVLKRQTPLEEIQAWYDQHHKNMPRLAKVAFKQLIAMAATWRAA